MSKQRSAYALLLIGLTSFLLLVGGCSDKRYFEQFQVIEKEWDKEQAYSFTFDIVDTTLCYNIFLHVRNNNLYPYQNLWIFCSIEQPIGQMLTDTIECVLADDFGKWKGKGISIFQQQVSFKEAYHFPYQGQYTFSFRHGMRSDALKGIEEIGIEIDQLP